MKPVKIFFSILFAITIISCNNSVDQKSKQNLTQQKATAKPLKKNVNYKPINKKESTCIFAASELEKYIKKTKKLNEFNHSKYLQTISSIHTQLKENCDFALATQTFVSYLNSSAFVNDTKDIVLQDDFKIERVKLIETAKDEYVALKEMAKAIAEISTHKGNRKMGYYYSKLGVQRLSEVNGDTIELKRNVTYSFPTHHFVHENLLNGDTFLYEQVILKTNHEVGSIKKEVIEAKCQGVVETKTKLDIYIKTI